MVTFRPTSAWHDPRWSQHDRFPRRGGGTISFVTDLGGHGDRPAPFECRGIEPDRGIDEIGRLRGSDLDAGLVVTRSQARLVAVVALGNHVLGIDLHIDVNDTVGAHPRQGRGGKLDCRGERRRLPGREAGGDGHLAEQHGIGADGRAMRCVDRHIERSGHGRQPLVGDRATGRDRLVPVGVRAGYEGRAYQVGKGRAGTRKKFPSLQRLELQNDRTSPPGATTSGGPTVLGRHGDPPP